jgi:hypothetical protein
MASLASAPVWLVLTLLSLGLLILIGPRGPYERVLALVHAWRGTDDTVPASLLAAPDISTNDAVFHEPNSKLAWFIAGIVIAVGLPSVWRASYRHDMAAELAEVPKRSSLSHICRFSIRIFKLRRVLSRVSPTGARERV